MRELWGLHKLFMLLSGADLGCEQISLVAAEDK